jgi:hypothetical protein
MSCITLRGWVQRGKVQARKAPSDHPQGIWIIQADKKELDRLATLRAASHTQWPRRPQVG